MWCKAVNRMGKQDATAQKYRLLQYVGYNSQ